MGNLFSHLASVVTAVALRCERRGSMWAAGLKEVKQSKQDKGVKGALKQEERTCTAMIPQLGVSGSGVPN